jgi:hypothetical protein
MKHSQVFWAIVRHQLRLMNFPEPGRTLQQAPKNEAPARGTRKSVPIQKELPNLDFPFGNTDLRYQMREQNQTINTPSLPVEEKTRVYGLTRETTKEQKGRKYQFKNRNNCKSESRRSPDAFSQIDECSGLFRLAQWYRSARCTLAPESPFRTCL